MRLALEEVEATGDASVTSVERARISDIVGMANLPEVAGDTVVWAVVLEGEFPGECVVTATGESVCPPGAETALVLLDEASGAVLLVETPAP